ncbi:MAG: excinuclease ABC subunit B [Candidatus Omnitrophota bacterium]|jgi:excinuclease ABC subunit B
MNFKLESNFKPAGDQPEAIDKLIASLQKQPKQKYATLLGVTGSGKTFTMANIIKALNKPTLVLSHNKTLVAQLYSEMRDFFPTNAVEYFVSYYDFYQPEAYVAQTDTFIEKDASINEDIDRLRLRATSSLLSRNDSIVLASVSCIYGLGSPEDYKKMLVMLEVGQLLDRDSLLKQLIEIRYERNDIEFKRGTFRVNGDTVDVFLAYEEKAVRVSLEYDEIAKIEYIDPLTNNALQVLDKVAIYPAKHFVTTQERIEESLILIEKELDARIKVFKDNNQFLEAQRIEQRTRFDMEMMESMGYCSGIENYSRILSGRAEGSRPYCLLDYFPDDYLIILDESHVTLPQIKGMYMGDKARKQNLVDFGFRLPSALDNRPLRIEEFEELIPQAVFVSATPSPKEIEMSQTVVEQVIRPTGLVDPEIEIRPSKGQIDDLIQEVIERAAKNQRVLVTTLTKRMSEDLTRFMHDRGVRAEYLHSEIDAIQRVEILRNLRKNEFDCLIGINLLREGLDLPEVSLVAILDADKEGFLRSKTSLIQTAGRAARHIEGHVILYADRVTDSMRGMMTESRRRREIQLKHNTKHGITPQGIQKSISAGIEAIKKVRDIEAEAIGVEDSEYENQEIIQTLESQMEKAARNLHFEKAIELREQLQKIKLGMGITGEIQSKPATQGKWKRDKRKSKSLHVKNVFTSKKSRHKS